MDEEVVFRTSPAMQILDIPERKPPEPTVTPASRPSDEPPPASPWRWPVALIISTAIAVVGFLYYKKTQTEQALVSPPPATEPGATALMPDDEGSLAPASQPASAPTQLALAPGSDAGATEPEPGAGTTADDPGAPSGRSKARSRRGRRRRGRGARKSEPAKTEPRAAPKPVAAKPRPRPRPGGKSALDNLLDDAIGSSPAPAKKPTAAAKPAAVPGSNLPEQLTMNQIRAAMNRIKGRVQSCYDQFQVEGMAKVRFKITPNGKVADATIRGKFRGTDTGDCVVKAVKKATFPKFSGKAMTIKSYPFLLQ
jgi:hypothetical protein